MAAGVMLVLVVGGIGGLTMRAFAGVARGTAKTKTVTRFCVFVDRTNHGDSNGDPSADSKFGHKTCASADRQALPPSSRGTNRRGGSELLTIAAGGGRGFIAARPPPAHF